MRNRVRSPWDSCQLDSGLDDLSCVRSPTRGHREVLSQMRCPGGRGAGAGVVGGAAVGRGGRGAGGGGGGAGSPPSQGGGGGGGFPPGGRGGRGLGPFTPP